MERWVLIISDQSEDIHQIQPPRGKVFDDYHKLTDRSKYSPGSQAQFR